MDRKFDNNGVQEIHWISDDGETYHEVPAAVRPGEQRQQQQMQQSQMVVTLGHLSLKPRG